MYMIRKGGDEEVIVVVVMAAVSLKNKKNKKKKKSFGPPWTSMDATGWDEGGLKNGTAAGS